MVHRPDKAMFSKRSVILTNSIGASNRSAQKDIATSLNWMGISDVRCLGFGLMEGVIWNDLSDKRRNKIKSKTDNFAKKYVTYKLGRKRLKVSLLFLICKMLHKGSLKKEESPSADNQHWINNGWL
jgi:hypothetical protein